MKATDTTRSRPLGIQLRASPELWFWIALNVLDAALTAYLLGMGGTEGNPMLSLAQLHLGVGGMLLIKITLASFIGLVIASRGQTRTLKAASVLMTVVVVYNLGLALYVTTPGMTLPFIS